MKIAILGYGKEGKSVENYFKTAEIEIFDQLTPAEFSNLDLSNFDLVFRSPSVPPLENQETTSITKYFFDHCSSPIIGVTGTKGKGTTCSLIKSLLESLGKTVHLVGNIGNPALDILDKIRPTDVVVYELSSFQLWDLKKSPNVAVVLRIEPDHLNVHKDYADYVDAKSNIARHQSSTDVLIYYKNNPDSTKIAETSPAEKFSYPCSSADSSAQLLSAFSALALPGAHNRENAEAALLAVAAYLKTPLKTLLEQHLPEIKQGLANFTGLPHRLEFVRELNGVKYYDDNFSTTLPSLEVALKSFPDHSLVLILGGRDKTGDEDLPAILNLLATTKNLTAAILLGESGHALWGRITRRDKTQKDDIISTPTPVHPTFILTESLKDAVEKAQSAAEPLATKTEPSIVLMSPAAASFDMFENVYDRGDQFQSLVKGLN